MFVAFRLGADTVVQCAKFFSIQLNLYYARRATNQTQSWRNIFNFCFLKKNCDFKDPENFAFDKIINKPRQIFSTQENVAMWRVISLTVLCIDCTLWGLHDTEQLTWLFYFLFLFILNSIVGKANNIDFKPIIVFLLIRKKVRIPFYLL